MSSEKPIHPGRRRQAPPADTPLYVKILLDDLISDWKNKEENSFICRFLASKRPTCTDITKLTKNFFYDMEARRRLLENQPIDFLREYCKYKGCSSDYFLFNSNNIDNDAINQLIQKQTDFVVPIFIDTLTGDITFLRSKRKYNKDNVDYKEN